jgi:hypothetical protein
MFKEIKYMINKIIKFLETLDFKTVSHKTSSSKIFIKNNIIVTVKENKIKK